MACADTSKNEIMVFTVSVEFSLGPFLLILLSYICIFSTILQLPSGKGRRKAFSTCCSHLTMVTLFYGTALITYLLPKSSSSLESDQMISLMNTMVIYSENNPGENKTTSEMLILVGFSYLANLQSLLFFGLLVIYLVILMGNLLVIFLIKLNPSLHTPMYFFLVNLSASEICFTSSVVPQLLAHLLVEEKTLSIAGCAAQLCVFTTMGLTECSLLAAMAYDRYVAICHPLQYTTILSSQVCALLAGASWFIGLSAEVAVTIWIFSLPFCGSSRIPHFFCDIPPVLKMACVDTSQIKILGFFVTVLFIMSPFLLILLSYLCIISTILKLPSAEGRRKAFCTCSSHLMVVTLFYGTALSTYLVPKSSSTTDNDLLISLLNTIVSPVLNPIIYTLRNAEVKGALRSTVVKGIFSHSRRNPRLKSRDS
ncbi:olfactory receptor 10A4-like [Carettochelys insculpta]|uniref:olfactory receptor 10A4-like n=1 Tax=Carettochelys insculpta TaxID=44489 RepID=UPI003EBCDB4D